MAEVGFGGTVRTQSCAKAIPASREAAVANVLNECILKKSESRYKTDVFNERPALRRALKKERLNWKTETVTSWKPGGPTGL